MCPSKRPSRMKALALVMLLAGLLTGCGRAETKAPVQQTSVVVVAGNTKGSVPANPNLFSDLIEEVVNTNGMLDIIVADGNPQSALGGMQTDVASSAANERNRELQNRATAQRLMEAVRDARPDDEEADVLSAIALARRELMQVQGRRIVVVSASGLTTSGLLDFRVAGLLSANPEEVASYYEAAGELPDLSGVEIVLFGTGDTANPQPSLTESGKHNVTAIYQVLLTSCGADVTVSEAAPSGAIDPAELLDVSLVDVPTATLFQSASVPERVVLDETLVEFVPDTAEYADPGAANTVLVQIVQLLEAYPDMRVKVVGSAASLPSDHDWAQRLSEMRGEAVAQSLVSEGVSPERIQTVGIGDGSGEGVTHVQDLDPETGLQVPQLASQNRTVTLIFDPQDVLV